MLACLIYQGWRIFPFPRLARRQVHSAKHPRPSDELTLLVANVLMTNRAVDRLLALIRRYDPDLILLVETDAWWTNQLQQALAKAYPFSVRQPQRNTYGMALFSRLTLLGPEVRFLIEEDVPSIRTRVLLRNGIPVWFYGVHPRPPVPTEDPTSTARDAELLVVGREVKAIREPVIVAGDLNDVAWSSTTRLFQHISGLLDPRRGRGFFQYLSCTLALAALAAGSRLPQQAFLASATPSASILGFGPFPGADHPAVCAGSGACAGRIGGQPGGKAGGI